ncbi:hypothetical protein LCGC14_1642620 [marine sediment metagenome]|uniref:Uncharacterized protein n=1 Tax=marine sediment metagenome TaxID=412755 RepID=A0A0F9HZX2_9ZZZZ
MSDEKLKYLLQKQEEVKKLRNDINERFYLRRYNEIANLEANLLKRKAEIIDEHNQRIAEILKEIDNYDPSMTDVPENELLGYWLRG